MEILKYFLEFTFDSFWKFIGVLMLLGIVSGAISNILSFPIKIVKNYKSDKEKKD